MPVTLPTRPSIEMVYTVPRMGATIETSNRWFFDLTSRDFTFAEFEQLFDAIRDLYDGNLDNNHTMSRLLARNAGSEVVVQTRELGGVCSGTWSEGVHSPSDCAAVVRMLTDGRTSRNHPIYLFKYWHGVKNTSADPDSLTEQVKTSVEFICQTMVDGLETVHESLHSTWQLCGPFGHIAVNAHCLPEVRHRDFPR